MLRLAINETNQTATEKSSFRPAKLQCEYPHKTVGCKPANIEQRALRAALYASRSFKSSIDKAITCNTAGNTVQCNAKQS